MTIILEQHYNNTRNGQTAKGYSILCLGIELKGKQGRNRQTDKYKESRNMQQRSAARQKQATGRRVFLRSTSMS